MHLVVGSGPAGVACAEALLAQGCEVTMIDSGERLEPERREAVEAMAAVNPSAWTRGQKEMMTEGTDVSAKGIGTKYSFGSEFPYAGAEEHVGQMGEGTGLRPSLALGGFSNVWGAAMLPHDAAEIADWPVGMNELAPHYTAVTRITGLAGQRDRLEKTFPLFHEGAKPLRMSPHAQALYHRLERHATQLERQGIQFGASRLAVRVDPTERGPGCCYCRMCMYGCVYGCIFNSADTVAQLRLNPRFTYLPGVVVVRVKEENGSARAEGYRRDNGEAWSLEGERIFLAAGVLPTSRVLLASNPGRDECVVLDSQYFLFPLIAFLAAPGSNAEEAYTLSQIFIEMRDAAVSPRRVHLQVYARNDMIGAAVQSALGPFAFAWLVRAMERRAYVMQGYLHSDHSARLRVRLDRSDPRSRISVTAEPNPETRSIVKKVVRKFLRHAGSFGALPGLPFVQVTPPGRGYHCGGSWPMRAKPVEGETDTLGRPAGWSRVHAVDATVLPSLPSTTITFTAMANAHRIASAAAKL